MLGEASSTRGAQSAMVGGCLDIEEVVQNFVLGGHSPPSQNDGCYTAILQLARIQDDDDAFFEMYAGKV